MSKTGLVWEERFVWHDPGSLAVLFGSPYIQYGEGVSESPESKRRIRNLLDVVGVADRLHRVRAREATREEICRCHDEAYVDRVASLSAGDGGLVGPAAWIGRGGFAHAALSAGGAITAVDAVLKGEVDNIYALVRPPGHHAGRAMGGGLCIFNNVAIAVRHAQATHNVKRVAIVDWDAHHGNGTQDIFWDDPSVLTISLHQKGAYPGSADSVTDIGAGAGAGYNINVPFPPGTGTGAYLQAFEEVVAPALTAFRPDLILVASGFDAGYMDFSARLMVHAEGFREMTRRVKAMADAHCKGRLVLCHEGGYSLHHAPFLGLAVLEELCGWRSGVEDPLKDFVMHWDGHDVQPHQAAVISEARKNILLLSDPSRSGNHR
ncbi:MAG: class II histone deacetylase [Hyphomonadaceae bacterium]|nr:class II histone deacetylase [Hyphomonadaceae bacterium]